MITKLESVQLSEKDGKTQDLKSNYKLWFERNGEYIFGPGACAILKAVHEQGTITKGAQILGMSYRYAWGVIKKIEKKLGVRLVETYKGGTVGGGGARVTEEGLRLVEIFSKLNDEFNKVLKKTDSISL
ncbi:LysR family transcriptional regulator [Candidatus Thorarchaeota archaeon]|nr:MAG: LysR family transcriptional regulator [Candidatus Thorarchaeota archaeon]